MTSPVSDTRTSSQFNPLAVAGFVVGLICPFFVSIVTAPIAIVCGHVALFQIKRANGLQRGSGLAIAGLILGYLSLALGLIGLVRYLLGGDTSLQPFLYSL